MQEIYFFGLSMIIIAMAYRLNGNMLDEEFKGNVLILETVKLLYTMHNLYMCRLFGLYYRVHFHSSDQ